MLSETVGRSVDLWEICIHQYWIPTTLEVRQYIGDNTVITFFSNRQENITEQKVLFNEHYPKQTVSTKGVNVDWNEWY